MLLPFARGLRQLLTIQTRGVNNYRIRWEKLLIYPLLICPNPSWIRPWEEGKKVVLGGFGRGSIGARARDTNSRQLVERGVMSSTGA